MSRVHLPLLPPPPHTHTHRSWLQVIQCVTMPFLLLTSSLPFFWSLVRLANKDANAGGNLWCADSQQGGRRHNESFTSNWFFSTYSCKTWLIPISPHRSMAAESLDVLRLRVLGPTWARGRSPVHPKGHHSSSPLPESFKSWSGFEILIHFGCQISLPSSNV